MKTLPLACFMTLLGALLILPGCGQASASRPKNVILVCIDTLRADHLGCYGYRKNATSPFLDGLAADGLRFADVSAAACWTKPSVPSYLTGTFPLQHGVYLGSSKDEAGVVSDVLPEDCVTLAEVFRERGYRTGAFVRNAQLRVGQGFEQGFERYVDGAGDAREIRWRAEDWLEEAEGDEPFFLYLHFFDAHWPYPVPEAYARRFTDSAYVDELRDGDWKAVRDAVNDGEAVLEPADLEAMIDLYDGAIRYVDDQLAQLFAELERDGLAEDTIVCVISDHGEEFLEHGKIGHGHGLYEGLLQVPWILCVPGAEPRVVEQRASLVDLFPTLLGAAGIGVRERVEGIDLLAGEGRERGVFAEHLEPGSYQQSLRRGTEKVVRVVRVPEEDASPSAEERSLADLRPGSRWEAQFGPAGALGPALRLRPRTDDDEDEQRIIEVKGPLEALEGDRARINGLALALGASTRFYGETVGAGGAPRVPAVGTMVKAVGERIEDGRLVVEKLKLYADDAELERELRGPLSAVEVEGMRVALGGLWVQLGEQTDIDHPRPKRRMDRGDAWSFVEALDGEQAPDYRVTWRAYDLASDPAELAPDFPEDGGEVARLLDALSRLLMAERRWGETDRSSLSEADVEALRGIGYGE